MMNMHAVIKQYLLLVVQEEEIQTEGVPSQSPLWPLLTQHQQQLP